MNQDYPVQFSVEYPERDLNRLTTAFRIFTVIPIAIVLASIGGYTSGEYDASGETDEDVFDPAAYEGQTHVTAPERAARTDRSPVATGRPRSAGGRRPGAHSTSKSRTERRRRPAPRPTSG